jgi:putative ABC transport system permease protein
MLKISSLTWKSLRYRRLTVALTVLSIGLSVALLLGVERIRREVQTSFTNTVSGTDLIVGARSSPVSLLLSSVFRIGDASNNMTWDSYQALAEQPSVRWTIPISLGDSHRGYRVLGTTETYLDHLQYGRQQSLQLREGTWFTSDHETVLGAEVASALGYRIGDQVVVAHGAGEISFIEHGEHPFTVSGILKRTGTPVDRTVHVDLSGITAMHAGLTTTCDHGHDPLAGCDHNHRSADPSITAVFMGLNTRAAALSVQRMINEYKPEALSAVMPGLALQELWEIVSVVEKVLLAISGFVIAVGLCGMLVALMASLNERRREMAILRSVGARPVHVLRLIAGESVWVTFSGVLSGFLLLYALLFVLRPLASSKLGLHLTLGLPTVGEMMLGSLILVAGSLVGLIPAWRSYRYSLADGLTVKL